MLKTCRPAKKEAAQRASAASPLRSDETADAAPGDVIRRLTLREIRQLRRFLTVIKELIEWALESASEFFQRFDGRNSMTILYAGNVATKQTRSLFDVALGEFLFFAECAKTVTNNHADIIPCRQDGKQVQSC